MNLRWFRREHEKDPKLKASFEQAILGSSTLSTRFMEILSDMEEDLYKYEGDLTNYSGDWAAKQAFVNGKRKTLRDIRALFNFAGPQQ